MQWETVIGLEVHTQLATKSKIFSGASTAYGAAPNTQACNVDLAFPGVLPVLNREAVNCALKFGVAVGADIGKRSVFARKNYFYPDLPKGYQISQFELPIVGKGELTVELENGESKVIGITRAHLEEDAGKSLHEDFHGLSGIDLNRAGTPLLEIVSEPDMRSIKEAVAYARKIHQLVVYLGICDGNMQEGSFRVDANLSIRPYGQEALGTRTELKNLNSFRFLERALNYELERQIDVLEGGGRIVQETRLYDADKDETRSMRSKEEANDYRYFPDPDLLPVEIDEALLEQIRDEMPELPTAKLQRFIQTYALGEKEAKALTVSRPLADYYEAVVKAGGETKIAANWVTMELGGALNKAGLNLAGSPVSPEQMGGLLKRIADKTISGKIAKQVFEAIWNGEGSADEVIEAKGLKQITDTGAMEPIIDDIIANNPKQVEQFRAGKEKLLGFFVGQVMKATRGKANPEQVNELLLKKLKV
ncbi:Asp-tRNA(Asn)/Glu-tRNA(Gln) amidotransferase subunit GatB [endosymbiont of Lamellibrachia barhami]|uniref:Asp-tRNA(Asn)/Glu-tRNA(Gln) amidotransferase subunit GatB n=1 Tax=endosymbiont of Lamellibrachia barhami TaxID=205975 RepID=UPI0015AF3405|nr:Asp-tRNA(Asn)/Glu-tRNA(Gln) amidotransferase subunit GatB [endosymbiont of Lamellibrachia barhami]